MMIEGLWLIAIPEELVKEKLLSFIPPGIEIEIDGLKKKMIPGLYIQRAVLKAGDTELILKEVSASIKPSLLVERPGIKIKANNSIIQGSVYSAGDAVINIDGLRLSEIKNPYVKGDCILFLISEIKGQKGWIEFSCKNARLEPFKEDKLYIPLNLIDNISGRINIDGKNLTIESVTFSGKDIYGRIKGTIENKLADLIIELMPEKELNSSLMLLMPGAMVSPGYFKIEIKRRL
ncbi:MAG: hypothetical protein N2257_01805 [Thermodesulfovibrionales bacterium]|nr:hypothetical protein [Thermodesulfovibrionales bacterium]